LGSGVGLVQERERLEAGAGKGTLDWMACLRGDRDKERPRDEGCMRLEEIVERIGERRRGEVRDAYGCGDLERVER
jgi:hypothetical protein